MSSLLDKFTSPDSRGMYLNLWYLRVALDVYAIASDIPLRIYHRDRLLQFYDDAVQLNEKFKNHFPDKATFDHQVSQWAQQSPIEIYRKIKELEITDVLRQLTVKYGDHRYFYRSNEHPLLRLFAEHQTWQWWEFCLFYDLFMIKQPVTETQHRDWGFNNTIHLCYKRVDDMQSFIVAGPVWKLETGKGKRTGESFEKEIVTPIVEQFIKMIQTEGGENLSPKKDRLIRLGNSRFEVSALNLESYLDYVADALQIFTNIQVAEKFELTTLHRSDYVKLAEWALFLAKTVNMVKEFYLPNCSQNSPPPPLCQQVPFYYFTRTYDGTIDKFRVKTHFSFVPASQKIVSELELLCDSSKFEPMESIDNTYLKATVTTEFLKRLGISFSRFLHDVLTKQNSARAEYLSFLRTWLEDRFGVLTDKENNELANEIRLENQLARRISWFLHADITTLYRYDYGREYLETIGVYCSTAQRDEWIKSVPVQMKEIQEKSELRKLRKQSICYRCVDTEQIRFCRNFDPSDATKIEPAGEVLLPPPPHLVSHKSGLVVPTLVHNRVWGVMEILGTRPHQFRWDDRRFTSELSETLSTFFYHQWLLTKLKELNKIAVQEKESPVGYDKISRRLAELLMSHGAAIWVYESQGGGYYKCKGVHQRQWDQNPYPSLRDEKIYLSDKDAVIIYTREELKQHPEKKWWEKHVDELPPHWQELARNKPLIESEIKTIACIPIYSSQPQDSKEVIAYIVLYNKAGRDYDASLQATERLKKYDERWTHYIGFVARYTGIVLEAIQAQTTWERRSRRFVRHEIKSNVNQISDRVSELKRIYRKDFQEHHPNISKEFLRRYDILISDLEIYTRYLQSNLDYLAEGNFAKYLRSPSPIAARIQDRIAAGEQPPIWLELRQAFNVSFRAAWILQRKKQLVAVYPHSKQTFIRIHEDSLHHILGNLCDNAIKYASEGSAIKIEEVEIDGSLEWSISNVGECLDESEYHRIFEEGARGSNAKQQSGEGKGLFIVRAVCELYGIAIRYHSEPIKENCVHKFILSFPPQIIKITQGIHS